MNLRTTEKTKFLVECICNTVAYHLFNGLLVTFYLAIEKYVYEHLKTSIHTELFMY